jgi:hypothetical protein
VQKKQNNTNTILIAALASAATFVIGVVLSTVAQDLLGQRLISPEAALAVVCILMLILIGLSINISGRLTSLVRTPTTVEYFDVTQRV